jgi:hypothetical protein
MTKSYTPGITRWHITCLRSLFETPVWEAPIDLSNMVVARRPRIQCFAEGLMLILAGDLPDCVEPTVEIEKLPQEHHVVVLC